jgi:hypothetical protein
LGGLDEDQRAHPGAASHDQALGALPRFGQPALDKELIGPDSQHA